MSVSAFVLIKYFAEKSSGCCAVPAIWDASNWIASFSLVRFVMRTNRFSGVGNRVGCFEGTLLGADDGRDEDGDSEGAALGASDGLLVCFVGASVVGVVGDCVVDGAILGADILGDLVGESLGTLLGLLVDDGLAEVGSLEGFSTDITGELVEVKKSRVNFPLAVSVDFTACMGCGASGL
jgi:hypothetical protein